MIVWYAFIIGLVGGGVAGACILRALQLTSDIRALNRAIDRWSDDISCYGFYKCKGIR